jgi:hypothetical protein
MLRKAKVHAPNSVGILVADFFVATTKTYGYLPSPQVSNIIIKVLNNGGN